MRLKFWKVENGNWVIGKFGNRVTTGSDFTEKNLESFLPIAYCQLPQRYFFPSQSKDDEYLTQPVSI